MSGPPATRLFELPKPAAADLESASTRSPQRFGIQKCFSANQLALLGSAHALPDETDVNEHKLLELADLFMEHEDDAAALEKALFEEAGQRLEQSDVDGAWMTLLAYNPG